MKNRFPTTLKCCGIHTIEYAIYSVAAHCVCIERCVPIPNINMEQKKDRK